MKTNISLVLALCFSLLATSAYADTAFSRNLSLGSSGSDVQELQIVLNQNSATRVALSGAGSPGQESTYFGTLTKQAVIKFQNLYPSEILLPAGLTVGNGFVGMLTRNVLNSLLEASTTSITSTTNSFSTTTATSIQNNQTNSTTTASTTPIVFVFSVNPFQVKPGGTVVISGSGFSTSSNSVYLGDTLIGNSISTSTTELSFQVPQTISLNTYKVRVTNNSGDSTNDFQAVNLVITNSPLPTPVISSISPGTIDASSTVSISGTGFTQSGNSVYSPFGIINNIGATSSTMLQFSVTDFSNLPILNSIPQAQGSTFQIPMYVSNANGSSNVGIVMFKIQ